jgi:hypothetical protein
VPSTSAAAPGRIAPSELMTPAAYAAFRRQHLQRLIAHRSDRAVSLGPCMRLQFEDRLTVLYQIHEVMRVERMPDARAMEADIAAYERLLPDGAQWKGTLQIEIGDAIERARQLPQLSRAVHQVYVEARGERVFAQANEDLQDRHLTRPSAVHFLRFALPVSLRDALHAGEPLTLGCTHPAYAHRRTLPKPLLARLVAELLPTDSRQSNQRKAFE